MAIEHIPLIQVRPNPWQPRTIEDHAHVKGLAESIATYGLLQVPSGRRMHTVDGPVVELAFGHSRLAAYEFLHNATDRGAEFATFPVNIVELNDRQMADAAAQENVSRKNLSAIEIARAIQRYIADFGATQLEAGKVYGYGAQSSVSNLLRLLQLPEPVQARVAAGELPERHARELVALARLDPKACAEVAADVAAALTKNDPDYVASYDIESAIDDALGKKGEVMDRDSWDPAWPGKPIAVAAPKKDEPASVPACKGCEHYHAISDYRRYCLQPACYALKKRLFAQHEAARVAKKLGVPMLADADRKTAKTVFDGDWQTRDVARVALELKHESLRIAPVPEKKNDHGGHYRDEVLGSGHVVLMSVDADALAAAVKKASPKVADKQSASDKYEEDRRKTREKAKRARTLADVAATHLAATLVQQPGIVRVIGRFVVQQTDYQVAQRWDGLDLETQARAVMAGAMHKWAQINEWNPPAEKDVIAKCDEAAKALGVRLPAGWSEAETPASKPSNNGKHAPKGRK
jgi:ParB/RepB/Spo0J family partition protein